MTTNSDKKRWTTSHAGLGTGPVPIAPYLSNDYFERERERIFRRVWLNVGRVEEIPRVGDYFIRALPVCSTSIIVARGKDGVIRSFHNMCSHRGNTVTRSCGGSAQRFVCGFHGWTYDLKGDLIYAPDEDRFFDLRKSEYGLTPIATDTWEDFIFVNVDPAPETSLAEHMGQLGEQIAGYPFGQMSLSGTYRAEVKVNWKIALNGFQEGYHVPFLHKRSAGRAYKGDRDRCIHALDFKTYPLHRAASFPGNPSYKPTPVEMVAHQCGVSITKFSRAHEFEPSHPPGLNPTKSSNWMFDMIVWFPNFFMFLFAGMYFTYHFWPVAVDRTIWETRIYHPRPANAGHRFSQEYAKCSLRDTLSEDGPVLEAVQANLASGAKTHFIFQDQEVLLRHSHHVVEELVGR